MPNRSLFWISLSQVATLMKSEGTGPLRAGRFHWLTQLPEPTRRSFRTLIASL